MSSYVKVKLKNLRQKGCAILQKKCIFSLNNPLKVWKDYEKGDAAGEEGYGQAIDSRKDDATG